MRNIIVKFGGTSVGTDYSIRKVCKIILNNNSIRGVVVSAVGGVTNLLVEFCKSKNHLKDDIIKKILEIHMELNKSLDLNIGDQIIHTINRLHKIKNKELNNKIKDHILSLGEDLSSLILTKFLNNSGIEAQHVDSRSFIITDNTYGAAKPYLERIKEYNFPNNIFVTQGFVGSTIDNNTSTLGRGGSDFSAALIAEVLNASELLIYTDVPGVYTIDPNICNQAMLIPKINFQEMTRMANLGAKILHPSTISPCVRAKIPVRIMSTFEPNRPGTFVNIEKDSFDYNRELNAITIRKNQILITIKNTKIMSIYNFLLNTFNILVKLRITTDLVAITGFNNLNISFIIDPVSTGYAKLNNLIRNEEIICNLNSFAEVTIEENLHLVSIIGNKIESGISIQKILEDVESKNIRFVSYGTNNSTSSILVTEDSVINVARTLHSKLIGT